MSSANIHRGIVLKLASEFVYVLMWVCTKLIGPDYPISEIVFLRSLCAFLIAAAILQRMGGWRVLKTQRALGLFIRSSFGIVAIFCSVYATARLPLAVGATLINTVPLFTCLCGVFLLAEKTSKAAWVAVIVGFSGILLLLQPQLGNLNTAFYVALLNAMSLAFATLMVRFLARTENTAVIVFYPALASLLVSGTLALQNVRLPTDIWGWGLLAGVGITGGIAQWLFSSAYRHADAATLSPFEYTSMLWSLLFGFLIWAEIPDWLEGAGIALILVSGLGLWWMEARKISSKPVHRDVIP